jgi:exodeoxyribonuclease VII large subunit
MSERVARCHERMQALAVRARRSVLARVGEHRRHLDGCGKLLASLSYHGVLQRGYALVRDSAGRTLRAARDIAAGQIIDIELADGRVDAQALASRAKDDSKRRMPVRPPPRNKGRTSGGNQGSLF